MLDLAAIKARIVAQCPAVVRCRVATDFAGVLALQACNPPECFVAEPDIGYGTNLNANGTLQQQTHTFTVFVAVRRTVDSTGEVWQSSLSTVIGQLNAALLNWKPGTDFDKVIAVDSRLQLVDRYLVFWAVRYSTNDYLNIC